MGRLAPVSAVLGRVEGLKGYHDITRYPDAAWFPAWCCSAGTRPCSSPTPNCSVTACGLPSPHRPRRCAGWSWRRTGYQRRRHCRGYPGRIGRNPARGRHRVVFCRDEGPRQGQAEAIRPICAVRRGDLFPDHGAAVSRYLKTSRWIGRTRRTRCHDQAELWSLAAPSAGPTSHARSQAWSSCSKAPGPPSRRGTRDVLGEHVQDLGRRRVRRLGGSPCETACRGRCRSDTASRP